MSTSTMKIYQAVGSPNSRRVRIFIAEKGIDIPTINLDLGTKEQFSDTYRAINPRSVVPTLVLEDGTSIGEVPAICHYLEEIHPEPVLLGSTPKEKVLIGMWDRRMEQEGFAARALNMAFLEQHHPIKAWYDKVSARPSSSL